MAFKLKNAGGSFKTMGSSPSPMKATPDELREAGVSQGMISGDHTDTRNSADVKKAEDRWSGGNEKASKNTGRSLDSLVKTRKGLEKGSPEYNAIQNEINKSLGDSTRHKQENKTKVDGMTIKKKGDGDDTNIKSTNAEGKKQTIKIRDGEVKGGEKKAADEKTSNITTKNKRHSDGTLKVKKRENIRTTAGITDKVERKSKDGKKTTVRYKTDTDGEKGYERKGKKTSKTDREGKVSTKDVKRADGRRTVTKSDGSKKSRRTLKGVLTGTGKDTSNTPT